MSESFDWKELADAVLTARKENVPEYLRYRIEKMFVPASVVATVDASLERATARATAAEAREAKLRDALRYIAWYHGEGHRVTEIARQALQETDNG